MNTVYDFADDVEQPIVYVREVALADLPEEVRAELRLTKRAMP